MNLAGIWKRLPLFVRAVVAGLLVAGTGQLPWTLLVAANVSLVPAIPWSAAVMVVYLALWWRYLQGWGWPEATREARRRDLRGGVPSRKVWLWSLLTAAMAGAALRAMADLARRLSPRPGQDLVPQEILAKYPAATILVLLLMTAVVSGAVEEAGFRGFMQAPLERRYGPRMAVVLVGIVFGLVHFRPEAPDMIPWLIFLPVYFVGAVVFGGLAALTGSILPGLLCHAAFNADGLLYYWRAGIPKSVWEAGVDASFRLRCALLLVFGLASVWLYRKLAAVAAEERTVMRNLKLGGE